jgi:polysaccharide export outer membrane protein
VQLNRALTGDAAADVALRPFDQLVVHLIPDWATRIRVTLGGEVRFPGVYAARKGERLSAVLSRAGGFTADAYLRAAQFSRESTRASQQAAIDRLVEELELSIAEKAQEARAGFDREDIEYNRDLMAARKSLVQQLRQAKANGRVIVQLPDDGKVERSAGDLYLEDGDKVEIPKKMNVVTVVGRVYNPTGVVFDPANPEAGYYLERVGGPTEAADTDHMFVLRADGSVEAKGGFFRGIRSVGLQPGDSVIVPEKLVQTRLMKDIKDVTQIMMQLAVTAAVVLRL